MPSFNGACKGYATALQGLAKALVLLEEERNSSWSGGDHLTSELEELRQTYRKAQAEFSKEE